MSSLGWLLIWGLLWVGIAECLDERMGTQRRRRKP
jgi:hypothetical protein